MINFVLFLARLLCVPNIKLQIGYHPRFPQSSGAYILLCASRTCNKANAGQTNFSIVALVAMENFCGRHVHQI